MKKYCKNTVLLGLWMGAALLLLSGCGTFLPRLKLPELPSSPATMEISLYPDQLENISFAWDTPERLPEWAEISVSARHSGTEQSIVVTIRVMPPR